MATEFQQLVDQVCGSFSNEEAEELAFILSDELNDSALQWDNLSGSGKNSKIRSLLERLRNRKELPLLCKHLIEKRPRISWPICTKDEDEGETNRSDFHIELFELINDRFGTEDEIDQLIKSIDFVANQLFEGGRKGKIDELIQRCEEDNKLQSLLEKLNQLFPNERWPIVSQWAFPFVNREQEKGELLQFTNTPLFKTFLIDAPAGAGKTALLYEIRDYFYRDNCKANQWHYAYLYLSNQDDTNSFIKKLVKEKQFYFNEEWQADQFIDVYVAHLLQHRPKGLILLIDFEQAPTNEFLQNLAEKFIRPLNEALDESNLYEKDRFYVRIIIAGRYMSSPQREELYQSLSLNIVSLSLFNHQTVKESVALYLPDRSSEKLNNIAADTIYFTGGHPGFMSDILREYRSTFKKFLSFLTDLEQVEYIDKQRKFYAEQIVDELPPVLERIIPALVPYRKLHIDALQKFSGEQTRFDLFAELCTTRLYKLTEPRWIKDDMIRRLLARFYCHHTDQFTRYSEEAIQFYREKITEKKSDPIPFVIELLFQLIQHHLGKVEIVDDTTKGIQARKIFYEEWLQEFEGMVALICDMHTKRQINHLHALLNKLKLLEGAEVDWEFAFAINYYFRGANYDDQYYLTVLGQCQEIVRRWIDRKKG